MSRAIARLAALAVIVACTGVAAAQTSGSDDGRFEAQWEARPGARDFERNYPRDAWSNNVSGNAQLCCDVRADRSLDCRVGFEWPQNQGFGAAAVRIADAFRMTPESYAAYQAEPDAWLQVPITFRMSPTSRQFQDAASRIAQGTRGLCRPPSVRTPQATEIPGMPEN